MTDDERMLHCELEMMGIVADGIVEIYSHNSPDLESFREWRVAFEERQRLAAETCRKKWGIRGH